MGLSIYEAWDDPAHGLSTAAFAEWPGERLDRDKLAPLLQGGFDNGDLSLPVYLVGKCSTYDTPHGHPVKGFMIQHDVLFAVSGRPGTTWPRITTMESKGVVNRRVASERLPEFNHIEVDAVPTEHGGYVDVQMSYDGAATARIGFIWSYGGGTSHEVASAQFRAVGEAIMRCREGRLPDGAPATPATSLETQTEVSLAETPRRTSSEIWDDRDVAPLFNLDREPPVFNLDMVSTLDDQARQAVERFVAADQQAAPQNGVKSIVLACKAGVQTVETLARLPSAESTAGWRKFILYNTACNVEMLWERSKAAEISIFADSVRARIERSGWGPDGDQSALGRKHSICKAIAAESGGGTKTGVANGELAPPTGHEAVVRDPGGGAGSVRPPRAEPTTRSGSLGRKRGPSCPMCGDTLARMPIVHAEAHIRPTQTGLGERYTWDCCGGPGGSWEDRGAAAAGLGVHWWKSHGIEL